MKELDLAKDIIITYLSKYQTPDGLYDVFEINSNNKEILKSHLESLIKIFIKAKEQLEKSDK